MDLSRRLPGGPSLRQISPETAVIVRRALCLDILGRRVERDRINVAMLKGRIDESAPPTLPRAWGFRDGPVPREKQPLFRPSQLRSMWVWELLSRRARGAV